MINYNINSICKKILYLKLMKVYIIMKILFIWKIKNLKFWQKYIINNISESIKSKSTKKDSLIIEILLYKKSIIIIKW